jgi:hypothetical protein
MCEREREFLCSMDLRRVVFAGKFVSALGRKWHSACFVCTTCKQPFVEDRFRKHQDMPYCDAHFLELTGVVCESCQKVIVGPVFSALGRKFHLECFVCEEDKVVIGEGMAFHFQEGKVWCQSHFEKRYPTCAIIPNPLPSMVLTLYARACCDFICLITGDLVPSLLCLAGLLNRAPVVDM